MAPFASKHRPFAREPVSLAPKQTRTEELQQIAGCTPSKRRASLNLNEHPSEGSRTQSTDPQNKFLEEDVNKSVGSEIIHIEEINLKANVPSISNKAEEVTLSKNQRTAHIDDPKEILSDCVKETTAALECCSNNLTRLLGEMENIRLQFCIVRGKAEGQCNRLKEVIS